MNNLSTQGGPALGWQCTVYKVSLIMFLGLVVIFSGFFIFCSVAQANTANVLQPAATVTYNEELVVNNTARFNSIYVGKQGEGGVTFFNGTIINSTTNSEGEDNPVTFGDNVRIDGYIHRGDMYEDVGNAVRVADSLEVMGSLTVLEIASAMSFTGRSVQADALEATYSFRFPVLSEAPTEGCQQDSDIGKAAVYNIDDNNTALAYCMKVNGNYTWVYSTE